MPPSSAGSEWPRSWPAGRAEQRAHARADVGDAVLAIDGPQPADAALLIFLEQQAGALALAADVGVGLQLVERPARDREDAEDRDAEREDDRQHVLERHGVAADQQRAADPRGERDHPRGDAWRNDDEAERADAEAGHDRGGDDLAARIERREQVERKAEPDDGADARLRRPSASSGRGDPSGRRR